MFDLKTPKKSMIRNGCCRWRYTDRASLAASPIECITLSYPFEKQLVTSTLLHKRLRRSRITRIKRLNKE